MLIDWFTVAAQAINFLILVWLLRRFLYRPVLATIEAREKMIATQLADAADRKAQAQKEGEDFRRRSDALDQQRENLLRKATDEADAARQRLLDAARKDAEALRSKLIDAVRNERKVLNRQIVEHTQEEVFAIARKTLADLAGMSLEERMTEVFLDHLRQVYHELRTAPPTVAPRKSLTSTLPGSPDAPAFVRSAFELSPAHRVEVESTVKGCLGQDVTVRFETAPNLVAGIELTWDGRKLAWSVADYLTSLSRNVVILLEPKTETPQVLPTEAEHAI